jgi:hypothetical protein
LAGAASQFLAFFKGNKGLSDREPRYQNLVMVLCYTALFLNINATIGSLVLLDTLGKEEEEEYFSSSNPKQVLERCGITPLWNRLRYLCKLLSFKTSRFNDLNHFFSGKWLRVGHFLLRHRISDHVGTRFYMARGGKGNFHYLVSHSRIDDNPRHIFCLVSSCYGGSGPKFLNYQPVPTF